MTLQDLKAKLVKKSIELKEKERIRITWKYEQYAKRR